jgi:hypothetical protein
MQGVHAYAATPDAVPIHGAFAFSRRIFSPVIGSQMFTAPPPASDDYRACARYLSVMGASHLAATHDFAGGPSRDLHVYVESDIFPDAADPTRRSHLRECLRSYIDAATDYGLGVHFDCRLLPCQGGPWVAPGDRDDFLTRFPAEVLSDCGTYQGKVLCFGHPTVRAFYREVVQRFFELFPEIDSFHYLTMDAEGEFCDPKTCVRCRGLSKFDQRDRLARFLATEIPRHRPGALILNTAHQWDRVRYGVGEMLARQSALPANVGICLAATGDSATFERQAHEQLREARSVTAKAGQAVVGRDALHMFEDAFRDGRQIFDYPLGVFAKVRRWNDLGFDGLYDVRGRANRRDLHANSLACRAAMLNPTGDPAAFCRDLAIRWFGSGSGPFVYDAWQKIEQAQAILSNGYSFPSSSPLSEYVGWHFGRATSPVPSNPAFTTSVDVQAAPEYGEFAPASGNGYTYHDGDYAACLITTGQCQFDAALLCGEAATMLSQATAGAGLAENPDAMLWLGDTSHCTPSRYLDDHCAFVANLQRFYGVMGPYLVLKGLRIRTGDDESYGREAREWLIRYAAGGRDFATHIESMVASGRISGALYDRISPELFRKRAAEVDAFVAEIGG